jgi:peptidoglycan/LPS O-acetylase OafA/YrhL
MIIKYKKEADGLRAIAVIAIICYHAQITIQGYQLFKGGFIGVDIFFIISGYLITSTVFKNLISGTFSFKYFCKRRIQRILPLLVFVILATFPFAWLLLFPVDLMSYSKSAITSLSFSSNLFYHYSGNIFGSIESLYKPLLNTWSLSVLIQFYILFIVIFFLIFKYFNKFLIYFIFFGFIVSLGLANWLSTYAPNFNFFILPSRVWEFLAGSILAYFEIKHDRKGAKGNLNIVFSGTGLFLIAYSIFYFNDQLNVNIFHPSIKTSIPIIGVFLIIWFSHEKNIITKILSSKFLVKIGQFSYSLYLWHYPIFAFNRLSNFTDNNIFKELFLGFVLVIVSISSYYLIEHLLKSKKIEFKKFFTLIILFILIIFITNQLVITRNGFKDRFSKIYYKNNIDNEELTKESWKYINNFTDQKFANNQTFQSQNRIKVLIIGDSHSLDLFNILFINKYLFKEYEFLRYGYNFFWQGNDFDKINKNIINFQNSKIFKQSDVILISDNFTNNHIIEFKALKKLDDFLSFFKSKKKIILTSNANIYDSNKRFGGLYNLTLFDYFLLDNSDEKKFIDKNLSTDKMLQINQYYFSNRKLDLIKKINNELRLISKKHSIKILYKENFQCNIEQQICFGVTPNGFKTNHDPSHFTREGAKFFGKRISKINWLKLE